MCPMDLSGRRRVAALALLMLAPLAACSDDAEPSPDTKAGDTVAGRVDGIETGKLVGVVTPAGRISVAFADPVDGLDKNQTTDRRARNAPEGGSFVPVVWSFEDDSIFREITRVFGDRKPLELDLVVDGEKYPLTPPSPGSGKSAEYVAVKGGGDKVSLEVTYNKVTQTLDEDGTLDKDIAGGLYDLADTKVKLKNCPIKKWFSNPEYFVQFQCQYLTAIPSPYVYDTWAKPGHTWLAVRLATNLALFATGTLGDSVASYDVVDTTDLSTMDASERVRGV